MDRDPFAGLDDEPLTPATTYADLDVDWYDDPAPRGNRDL
jgi:hypothetical protein